MAVFSFINRSSGSAYFVIETVTTGGFYDENSLNGTLGAYYNFTGSNQYSLVSSNHIAGYVVPPGSSSFEFNPTEYIQTGSVWFRGTGDLTVQIVGEVTSSVYGPDQISNKRILNTLPIENVFQATWDTTRTTAGSSTSTQIALPLMTTASGSLYNFVINWGDNTSSSISSSLQTETTHSYAVAGTYTTKMWGTMRGWRFANVGDRNKLQSVDKWGGLQFLPNPDGNNAAFATCQSASFANVIGLPDLRYTNSLRSFFIRCNSLTTVNNLDKWDVSKINNMQAMFYNCPFFNTNLGAWDVSNVTNFQSFLSGDAIANPFSTVPPAFAGSFNNGGSPSIGNWNVSKVTNFVAMFAQQPLFDQNLGNWNVSNATAMNSMFQFAVTSGLPNITTSFNNGGSPSIGSWDVSKVTNMVSMFAGATKFNQPIGGWNVSKVTTMGTMFSMGLFGMTVSGSFDQNIGNWNVSAVTNFANFMQNRNATDFSVANYDALLIGWASRPVVSGRSINFGTIKYSSAASASRAVLTGAPNNWTIVDGGQV